MKLSEAVELFISLRDKKAAMKTEYEASVAPIVEKMEKLQLKLLNAFDTAGMDSCRTSKGTAYATTRTAASIADPDAFMEHVKTTFSWEMLERRVNKSAVEAYQAETGDLPPGINMTATRVVNIRRS